MEVALWLLAIQGVIGAFDTLYYHEWRARLPGRGKVAAPELKLHAARDFLYAILFGTLPWIAWKGWWVVVLAAVLVAEIILTLWDFVIEIAVRRSLAFGHWGCGRIQITGTPRTRRNPGRRCARRSRTPGRAPAAEVLRRRGS